MTMVDERQTVRRTSAAATNPEVSGPRSVFDIAPPPQPKKPRTAAPAFDPLAIELKKDRPLPPVVPGSGSRYKALLERMVAGDSVDLPTAAAKSIVSTAKKLGVKVAVRVISAEVSGVWRL